MPIDGTGRRLGRRSIANWPTLKDLTKGGAHMLHDKFWSEENKNWVDREVVEMWWRTCGRMEGFWIEREGLGEG